MKQTVFAPVFSPVFTPIATGIMARSRRRGASQNYLLRIGGEIVQRIDGNKVVTTNPAN